MSNISTRLLDKEERSYWDENIQKFEIVHPLNAYGWGQVRAADGWKPTYLIAERDGVFCGAIMILEKKIPFTPFKILYAPKGPVWDVNDDETLYSLLNAVRNIAVEKKAIFLRVDPNIEESSANIEGKRLQEIGFIHLEQRWSYWNSPRDLSRIDLSKYKNIEEYLMRLDGKIRNQIKKGFKNNIKVIHAKNKQELKIFYDIFKDFAAEKKFLARGYDYQEKLWDEYIERGNGCLFLDWYNDQIIGGALCLIFGNKCLAMHLAAPYMYQKLGVSYAHVFTVLKWAKENNCIWFSWRGVGSTPSQEYFKNRFLPTVTRLIGYYDYPFNKVLYNIIYRVEFKILPKLVPLLLSGMKYIKDIRNKLLINKATGSVVMTEEKGSIPE